MDKKENKETEEDKKPIKKRLSRFWAEGHNEKDI